MDAAARWVYFKVPGQGDERRLGYHEVQHTFCFVQQFQRVTVLTASQVRTEPIKHDVEAGPAGRTMLRTVVRGAGLQQKAQEREVEIEVLETCVGEGLMRWTVAGVGPVGHQEAADPEAEGIDQLGLFFVRSYRLP